MQPLIGPDSQSSAERLDPRGRNAGLDLAGPGYHINRSNLLVLESKADMQKRGQASPDDGDALALTFAQPVVPAEVEEEDEEEEFGRYGGSGNSG
jgi:hypothetical protein